MNLSQKPLPVPNAGIYINPQLFVFKSYLDDDTEDRNSALSVVQWVVTDEGGELGGVMQESMGLRGMTWGLCFIAFSITTFLRGGGGA